MRKWIILLMMILIIPLVTAICCEKNKECIISETCQDAACGNCSITVYNRTGTVMIPQDTMTMENFYLYTYNASSSLDKYEIYPYAINCTNNKICQGDCQVEIKSECGEEGKGNMFAGIGILLLGITLTFVYFAVNARQKAFQLFFTLLAFLMIIADFRFSSMIIESIDSSLTGLISNMDTMYMISITIFRFLLFFTLIILTYWAYKIINGWGKKKRQIREEEWELGFR